MNIDPSTTKYLISARLEAEGIVEKPDIVGAVFGQTEGLLGEELEVRASVQVSEIVSYGPERLPAGPNVADSDAIIVVEGRQDVLNLLRSGIKNAIAVEGTNVPKTVQELSKEKVVTAFVDGDRGGDLILRELLQVAEVDFIARAPRGREVEELTQKQLTKSLRNKIPAEQFVEMYGLTGQVYKPEDDTLAPGEKDETPPRPQPTPRPPMPAPMRQEHRNEPRPEPRSEPRPEPRNAPRPEPMGDPD